MRYPVSLLLVVLALGSLTLAKPAEALSCLSVDQYLETVIGNEDIVVFTATTKDTITKDDYTAEALTVTAAHQGYVESATMVYHQKDETWGYFCNNGPKGNNTTGVYVAERDAMGMYQVTERLDTKEAAAVAFLKNLDDKEAVGEVVELTKEDRIARIYGSISDLFATLGRLLGELTYWSNAK